jgi:CO/xanthine dehydrogenase FAD-binding subunit
MVDFTVVSPHTVDELIIEIENNQSNNFRFGAGYTDLLLELKKQSGPKINVINLSNLDSPDFTSVQNTDNSVRIGSLVTAGEIVKNNDIKERYPVLHKAANTLASKQIRQVATVGGNICTASPAGDIATALVALEAVCEILSSKNEIREVPICDFMIGVRKTTLKKNEILRSVILPIKYPNYKIISDFIKIGTRKSMECAIVSLAYHILFDDEYIIKHAGIAIGSSAPTIKFTDTANKFLIGKKLGDITTDDKKTFADKVLDYASPISDIRGSEWYRRKVLHNISISILE